MATLLLADDSVTIQRVIELTFANESIRVVTAPDGHAATALLETERPDIVLADVGLPAVDGYTLAERLKRNPATATIPVLLLTGAFEPIDEGRARRTGCNGVLVKPFEPQRVVSLVQSLLAGRIPDNLWPNDMPRIDTGGPAPGAPTAAARPQAVGRAPLSEPGTMPAPSAIEEVFEIGLDDLDMAFSRLDPVAPPSRIDADAVSDFQRDIQELRKVAPEPVWAPAAPPRPMTRDAASPPPVEDRPLPEIDMDGLDWDLPAAPATRIDDSPTPTWLSQSPPSPVPAATPSTSAPPELPRTSPTPSSFAPSELRRTSLTPPVNVPVLSTPWTPPQVVVPAPPPVELPAPPPPLPVVEPVVLFAPAPVAPIAPPPVALSPTPPTPSASAPAELLRTSPTPPIAAPAAPEPPSPFTAPTLAAAFSALLSAEQSQPAATKLALTESSSSDAMVEAVVRRVAARLTGEVDRLVREELERLKR